MNKAYAEIKGEGSERKKNPEKKICDGQMTCRTVWTRMNVYILPWAYGVDVIIGVNMHSLTQVAAPI